MDFSACALTGKTSQSRMPVEGANARQVTFLKRRPGLFKKARVLCTVSSRKSKTFFNELLKKVVDKRRMELWASEASSSTACPRAIDVSMTSQINDEGCDSRGAEAGVK